MVLFIPFTSLHDNVITKRNFYVIAHQSCLTLDPNLIKLIQLGRSIYMLLVGTLQRNIDLKRILQKRKNFTEVQNLQLSLTNMLHNIISTISARIDLQRKQQAVAYQQSGA